jgi:hypothetical protein
LARAAPANLSFAGGRHAFDRDVRSGRAWPESWYAGLSDEQVAVLEPPYNRNLDRPVLSDDGQLTQQSRAMLDERGFDGIGRNPAKEDTLNETGSDRVARLQKEKANAKL